MTNNQILNLHYTSDINPEINNGMLLDISHELRTPLTVIQVALDLLSCGKLGSLSENEHRMVEIATNNTERLMRLTNAIEGNVETLRSFISEKELAQLRLERDLEMALSRNEFSLCYQPIVSLKNNKVIGLEALIRWEHPTFGTIYPDKFIPLAETNSSIIKIGDWVLKEACYQLCQWQHEFPEYFDSLTVSVNISSKQLVVPDLAAQIKQVLQETGLQPQKLVLEITESAIINNENQAKETLTKLQNLGIRLHIDDFGMGYSCLSRLYELPLNCLKIDRYFVQKLNCSNGIHIIEAITNMAHNLGLEVIAEGVETFEQVLQLQSIGCHKFQGYLFAKPLKDHEIVALLCGKINLSNLSSLNLANS